MPHLTRRHFLGAACTLPLAGIAGAAPAPVPASTPAARLAALEAGFPGRLGVHAFRDGSPGSLAHRMDERFPMCSTAKLLIVGAILRRSQSEPALMDTSIAYAADALVSYSPTTEKHVGAGLRVRELCEATITLSDNTAANLLLRELHGPAAVTAFARSIGDTQFRLDRWETALNSAIPGDPRDTTTPQAMARTLHRLALGDGLAAPQRQQLQAWLRGCSTGATRIRAGVPAGWDVGDKTGTGAYGSTNDIGVVWPPAGAPIVVAIYTTQRRESADSRVDVVAAAAKIVADWATAEA